jgi:drug/metabolite transporter (DMT)-like permease
MGFGTLGPLARFAADVGFTPVTFAVWRSIVSAATLVAILVLGVAVRRVPTTPMTEVSRTGWLQLTAMGLFIAGTTLGLFLAFERTTIAIALMVFYTFPSIVAVAAVPFYGEHLGGRRMGAITLATAGLLLLLVAPADGSTGGVDPTGVLFAFVASLCQVGFALVGARGFRRVPALQAATIARTFSLVAYALLVLPLLFLVGDGPTITSALGSAEAWVLILFAGIIGAALPAVLVIAGYRRVGPSRGAVLMLVLTGAAVVQLLPTTKPQAAAQPLAE